MKAKVLSIIVLMLGLLSGMSLSAYATTYESNDPATKYDLTLADGSTEHGTVTFSVGGAAATQAKKDDEVTVTVTPDEGYSVKDVTVRAHTTFEGAGARRSDPGMVDDIDVTPGENGTWTFTMPEANAEVTVTYTKNLQDAWIQTIADQTYTGWAIKPTVTVNDGETTLELGTDYTVDYDDNIDDGTAIVTVTAVPGSGYSGTATATFTIATDKSGLEYTISDAENLHNNIKDSNPDVADVLLAAIDAAKKVMDKADARQTEIETAILTLIDAMITAIADVERITLTIPAKSYVSCIDADKRQIETAVSGVSLYTVTSVSNKQVVLSSALNVVGAGMPFLIYNDNDVEKTVSIVVGSEDADDVTVASEFKGTLDAMTFTAGDMARADHYVLNGHDFVWVKGAGTLAAGKCWIELAKSAGARSLSIVFGESTGISGVSGESAGHTGWYDLSGRRVAKPAKGLYVKDGKKVVVK